MEVIQQEAGLEGKELCKNICKWIKTRVHRPMPADWEVWEIFLDYEIQMAQNVGWEDRNAKNSLLAVTRGWLSQSIFLAVNSDSTKCAYGSRPSLTLLSLPLPLPFFSFSPVFPCSSPSFLFPPSLPFPFLHSPTFLGLPFPFPFTSLLSCIFSSHTTVQLLDMGDT